VETVFRDLGLAVFQRGWLSSNNVVFRHGEAGALTVVDTGYSSHAEQTTALLQAHAGAAGVAQVINTHLHSDHCGGNAALQRAWGAEAWVPAASFDAVRQWDPARLTYDQTDQRCERFHAARAIEPGEDLQIGCHRWRAIAVSGHDPEALVFHHALSGVLITADALWESRLAIVFPELEGRTGFDEALAALDTIEALQPRVVIPGHGAPFTDVAGALAASRARIAAFQHDPVRHARYAARALTVFRLMEQRTVRRTDLESWLVRTPIFATILERCREDDLTSGARELVESLVRDRLLIVGDDGQELALAS
jgi:glyoxylase-like metal-dependent hydrolase (beta-lactamase superfamily II)